jgi:magnesium chelatase family protein
MDRIDIQIELPRLEHAELLNSNHRQQETSQQVRARVIATRERQLRRQGCLNAKLGNQQIERYCALDRDAERILIASIDKLKLTARSYHKVLRLARSIADMANEVDILPPHLAEAIAYRRQDRRGSQG